MANCLLIQHVAPESGFAISDALNAQDVSVDVRQVFAGEELPESVFDYDGVVIMGGPMSAGSNEGFATRLPEIGLLTEAIQLAIPTLGVCLGAQLLAVAAGAKVYRGAGGPEIGWGPIELLDDAHADPLFSGVPTSLNVLHWHGDTFDLPNNATHLAQNANYVSQAFRLGDTAWGLQFHIEVTAAAVSGFVEAFANDAETSPGGGVGIRKEADAAIAGLSAARDLILGRFAAMVAASNF